jgi:hypothetical protein
LNNGLVTKTMNEGMLQAKIRQVYSQIDGACAKNQPCNTESNVSHRLQMRVQDTN